MLKKFKFFILIFTISIVLNEITIANTSKNRQALVIGNGNYDNEPTLKNPLNDAEDISAKLKSLGFTVTTAKNLDRREMWKVFRKFKNNLDRDTEIAIFYYAGHGAQYNNINYLIPVNSQARAADELTSEAISAQDVLQQIEEQKAQFNLLILDACRNLPYNASSRGGKRGLAEMTSSANDVNSLVVFSTAAGETAADAGKNGRNSPYTQVLLENLDQNLPLGQLINNVAYEVGKQYEQRPYTNGAAIPPHLFLKPQTEQAPSTPQQIAVNSDNSSNSENFADSSNDSSDSASAAISHNSSDSKNCRNFYKQNSYAKAAAFCKNAAAQGDAEAQYNLGFMYALGEGVANDFQQAAYWIEKAAVQGYTYAQFDLGSMYYNGEGVTQDYEQAAYWHKKAAKKGDADAQFYLGNMYASGEGVAQNYERAIYWYQKSAAQGNAYAQFNLGNMYAKGEGVTQDYKLAYIWISQAVQQGDDDAADYVKEIGEQLTKSEFAEAQQLAQQCQNSNFKDCGY